MREIHDTNQWEVCPSPSVVCEKGKREVVGKACSIDSEVS